MNIVDLKGYLLGDDWFETRDGGEDWLETCFKVERENETVLE